MSTNEQYCAYIDKSKILPWIESELIRVEDPGEDANWIDVAAKSAYRGAMIHTRNKIKEGFFDFQRGSE